VSNRKTCRGLCMAMHSENRSAKLGLRQGSLAWIVKALQVVCV